MKRYFLLAALAAGTLASSSCRNSSGNAENTSQNSTPQAVGTEGAAGASDGAADARGADQGISGTDADMNNGRDADSAKDAREDKAEKDR